MPYSEGHKARTRARILTAAAQLFRRDGFAHTSVDTLMGEAGLTRGGFYAHFLALSQQVRSLRARPGCSLRRSAAKPVRAWPREPRRRSLARCRRAAIL